MLVACGCGAACAQSYKVEGMALRYTDAKGKTHRFQVAPAQYREVAGEAVVLKSREAAGFWMGDRLTGPDVNGFLNTAGSLMENTLVLRDSLGRILVRDEDYVLVAQFGMLGLGDKSTLKPGSTVTADYRYSLQRVDALVKDKKGKVALVEGEPALLSPKHPVLEQGQTLLCNVYVSFGCVSLSDENIFPVLEAPSAWTPYSHRSKELDARIKDSSRPLRILCWGDSITAGAEVEAGFSWPEQLKAWAAKSYGERAEVLIMGIGSTQMRDWLRNDDHFKDLQGRNGNLPGLTYQGVLDAKPDVVVSEFLNDMGLPAEELVPVYDRVLADFRARGILWVIMTPPPVVERYVLSDMRDDSQMASIAPFLRNYTQANGLSLADNYARWRHLYKEGIPYFAHYNNGYNHPDSLGHRVMAEEVAKVLDPAR